MKKLNDLKTTITNNKRYILLFVFLITLCSLFPYTGDDWAWGSKIGLERLYNGFNDYNGRYGGNLIVIALTRIFVIRNVTMAGTILGIIYLCEKIIEKNNKNLFLLATFLFLAIPKLVFRQAIVWTSGFANYAISIFLVIIYVYLIKDLFEKN